MFEMTAFSLINADTNPYRLYICQFTVLIVSSRHNLSGLDASSADLQYMQPIFQ